jgi:hypothetical protein
VPEGATNGAPSDVQVVPVATLADAVAWLRRATPTQGRRTTLPDDSAF